MVPSDSETVMAETHVWKLSLNIMANGAIGDLAPEALEAVNDPLTRLERHWQMWRRAGFETYQFTLNRRDPTGPRADVRVRVSAGRVCAAHRLDGGEHGPADPQIGTVDDYFTLLARVLSEQGERAQVHYHPRYGYPMSFALPATDLSRSETDRQLA